MINVSLPRSTFFTRSLYYLHSAVTVGVALADLKSARRQGYLKTNIPHFPTYVFQKRKLFWEKIGRRLIYGKLTPGVPFLPPLFPLPCSVFIPVISCHWFRRQCPLRREGGKGREVPFKKRGGWGNERVAVCIKIQLRADGGCSGKRGRERKMQGDLVSEGPFKKRFYKFSASLSSISVIFKRVFKRSFEGLW